MKYIWILDETPGMEYMQMLIRIVKFESRSMAFDDAFAFRFLDVSRLYAGTDYVMQFCILLSCIVHLRVKISDAKCHRFAWTRNTIST